MSKQETPLGYSPVLNSRARKFLESGGIHTMDQLDFEIKELSAWSSDLENHRIGNKTWANILLALAVWNDPEITGKLSSELRR